MIISNSIIEFNGMPLFQKARFKAPYTMEGAILEFACFFYMKKGSMVSIDSRGATTINENEAIIKNCNNYIQNYFQKKDSKECEAIAVYLYPDLIKEIYKDEIPSFLTNDEIPIPKKLIGNKLIEQYMNNLSIYFEEPDTLDKELGILKLKELIMILLKSENHQNIRKLISDIFRPVNVKFKDSIDRNIFNNLSINQLAFICNMSLSTFRREFKKYFDTTPAKYIKDKRLSKAATLLSCSNDAIGTIAFDTGFQDVTTFSAVFLEKYKISPSKYRLEQNRK